MEWVKGCIGLKSCNEIRNRSEYQIFDKAYCKFIGQKQGDTKKKRR